MYYETNCTEININQWNKLMQNNRKCSYKRLTDRLRKEEPYLYRALGLEFSNPYEAACRQTKTHYILVHSAIEYFLRKDNEVK